MRQRAKKMCASVRIGIYFHQNIPIGEALLHEMLPAPIRRIPLSNVKPKETCYGFSAYPYAGWKLNCFARVFPRRRGVAPSRNESVKNREGAFFPSRGLLGWWCVRESVWICVLVWFLSRDHRHVGVSVRGLQTICALKILLVFFVMAFCF